MTYIMFYTFRFYSSTRQRRPFGNRCLEHFPGEYDQFGMIKLRFTAPGSAGYVHIPQGVTVFHKSLVARRRPRIYNMYTVAATTTAHAIHTIDRRRRFYPRPSSPRTPPPCASYLPSSKKSTTPSQCQLGFCVSTG